MFDAVGLGFEPHCLTCSRSRFQEWENPEVPLPILSSLTLLVYSKKALLKKKKTSKHIRPTHAAGARNQRGAQEQAEPQPRTES